MKIFPLIIVFLCAISLQGCGGESSDSSSPTPPPNPPYDQHLYKISIERDVVPFIKGQSEKGDVLFGQTVSFKAIGYYDDGRKPSDLSRDPRLVYYVSDPSLLKKDTSTQPPTKGYYVATTTNKAGGKVQVHAILTKSDQTKLKSNVITDNVRTIEPYAIKLTVNGSSTDDDIDTLDVPTGAYGEVYADVQWNDSLWTHDNKVEWDLQGDAFKEGYLKDNVFRYLSQGQEGDESTLTASFQGLTSNTLTLRVTDPVLKQLKIAVTNTDLPSSSDSIKVPRGMTAQFKALATYDNKTIPVTDITNQVIWHSTNSKSFVQKDNTFRSVGDGGTATISAYLDKYPSIKSKEIKLKASPAELIKVKTELKQGDKNTVPQYLSRTLKVIGVYKGDDNADGTSNHFEEDITNSATCENDNPQAFSKVEDKDTNTSFRAVGPPNSFSTITCKLPNNDVKDIEGVKLTVVDGTIKDLSIEKSNKGMKNDVPKNQLRSFKVIASYDTDPDIKQDEDVTNKAFLILTNDDDFTSVGNDKVKAIGETGHSTSVSANFNGMNSSNEIKLTVKEAKSEKIVNNKLVFYAPPEHLMTWSEGNKYCQSMGERLPKIDELHSLSTVYVGPNYGWPIYKDAQPTQNEAGIYWSSEQEPGVPYMYQAENMATGKGVMAYDRTFKFSVACVAAH
ncbi:DUF1566 domain-containing protein [Photobacterium angustum]|uniref:DUF1566 domain-containing protein n=1 Tax=Photobacterium angustum TaxID=661 RepID=UPI0005DBBADF|nr:DUF1566 domain-containing protein [Photobacterium angustum]KJF93664.1 hypothetical protein UB39_14220 [Photobacterium angustum]PSW81846.1 DUF1566 domain-containing protein [Photobacterium angustum]